MFMQQQGEAKSFVGDRIVFGVLPKATNAHTFVQVLNRTSEAAGGKKGRLNTNESKTQIDNNSDATFETSSTARLNSSRFTWLNILQVCVFIPFVVVFFVVFAF